MIVTREIVLETPSGMRSSSTIEEGRPVYAVSSPDGIALGMRAPETGMAHAVFMRAGGILQVMVAGSGSGFVHIASGDAVCMGLLVCRIVVRTRIAWRRVCMAAFLAAACAGIAVGIIASRRIERETAGHEAPRVGRTLFELPKGRKPARIEMLLRLDDDPHDPHTGGTLSAAEEGTGVVDGEDSAGDVYMRFDEARGALRSGDRGRALKIFDGIMAETERLPAPPSFLPLMVELAERARADAEMEYAPAIDEAREHLAAARRANPSDAAGSLDAARRLADGVRAKLADHPGLASFDQELRDATRKTVRRLLMRARGIARYRGCAGALAAYREAIGACNGQAIPECNEARAAVKRCAPENDHDIDT